MQTPEWAMTKEERELYFAEQNRELDRQIAACKEIKKRADPLFWMLLSLQISFVIWALYKAF